MKAPGCNPHIKRGRTSQPNRSDLKADQHRLHQNEKFALPGTSSHVFGPALQRNNKIAHFFGDRSTFLFASHLRGDAECADGA